MCMYVMRDRTKTATGKSQEPGGWSRISHFARQRTTFLRSDIFSVEGLPMFARRQSDWLRTLNYVLQSTGTSIYDAVVSTARSRALHSARRACGCLIVVG